MKIKKSALPDIVSFVPDIVLPTRSAEAAAPAILVGQRGLSRPIRSATTPAIIFPIALQALLAVVTFAPVASSYASVLA